MSTKILSRPPTSSANSKSPSNFLFFLASVDASRRSPTPRTIHEHFITTLLTRNPLKLSVKAERFTRLSWRARRGANYERDWRRREEHNTVTDPVQAAVLPQAGTVSHGEGISREIGIFRVHSKYISCYSFKTLINSSLQDLWMKTMFYL